MFEIQKQDKLGSDSTTEHGWMHVMGEDNPESVGSSVAQPRVGVDGNAPIYLDDQWMIIKRCAGEPGVRKEVSSI
jgi:hypothetical protein